ncbi:MAG: hypothetical protein KQJ78_18500 [Deltaproteobacteria bacterium]|nr:hypothetical protein [Deltaproteobacteria bacterium]
MTRREVFVRSVAEAVGRSEKCVGELFAAFVAEEPGVAAAFEAEISPEDAEKIATALRQEAPSLLGLLVEAVRLLHPQGEAWLL